MQNSKNSLNLAGLWDEDLGDRSGHGKLRRRDSSPKAEPKTLA
ncbi:hypothetical protein LuPra_01096 [Luteitalea pratensis]|uniref:Uncharacterized protein n=1 Tax=Luteitalea pratensis TaxID=1855912 RepID=A0A143PI26_LUTPR|nr:hypothetical protein LuPra_01096 [Luteitalea pratensis]